MESNGIFKHIHQTKSSPILDSKEIFYINHHDYTTQLDSGIESYIRQYKICSNIDEEISILRDFVSHYNAKKAEAEALGAEYKQYFDDMYEHCHNSREEDFSLISYYQDRLQYLVENYEKEKDKERKLITLHDDVISLLKENDGILQKDFCKLFDLNIRNEVRNELYFADKKGLISREKIGNTYILHVISY